MKKKGIKFPRLSPLGGGRNENQGAPISCMLDHVHGGPGGEFWNGFEKNCCLVNVKPAGIDDGNQRRKHANEQFYSPIGKLKDLNKEDRNDIGN